MCKGVRERGERGEREREREREYIMILWPLLCTHTRHTQDLIHMNIFKNKPTHNTCVDKNNSVHSLELLDP